MAMKLIKKTPDYKIFMRGDERYAVQDANGKPVNGEEKVRILLAEELITVAIPDPAPEPAEAAEAEESETEAAAESAEEAAEDEVDPAEGQATEPDPEPEAETEPEPEAEPAPPRQLSPAQAYASRLDDECRACSEAPRYPVGTAH